jgi:aarF domain-containing kinase
MPEGMVMALPTTLWAGLLMFSGVQARDIADGSKNHGLVSKYIAFQSESAKNSVGDTGKFMAYHLNHMDGYVPVGYSNPRGDLDGAAPAITSPFMTYSDNPVHPTAHLQDFEPQTIVDEEEDKDVQKLFTNESSKPLGLSAIGVALLSFAAIIGVRIRRGMQPAFALANSSVHGIDMSVPMAPVSGENALDLKSQSPPVRTLGGCAPEAHAVFFVSPQDATTDMPQTLLHASSVSTLSSPSQDLFQRLQGAAEDAIKVAQETGPRAAFARTVQGQRAVLETLLELRTELPAPPPPETVVKATQDAQKAAQNGGDAATAFATPLLEWGRENVPPELAPRIARKLAEKLGATYVKLGQFVASSPTLFPAEWVREFENTLDAVPAISFEKVSKVVEAELGPINSVYATFDREPLAAASVAQVHRATLKDGRVVAVKILRPGVDQLLKADLGFLEVAGKFTEAIAPTFARVSLANVLADLRSTMLDELDLRKEADNLETFSKWLTESQLNGVATCPLPVREACSERVLTMDYLDGVALTDLDALRTMYGPDFDSERTLVNALNTWSMGVLSCDFFHADVHAGNLLAMEDGRVAFLDFGIVGRVPPRIWTSLRDAIVAFESEDYRGFAQALVTMGASDSVDLDQFSADLEALIKSIDEVNPQIALASDGDAVAAQIAVDDREITEVLLKVVQLTDRNGIKLPREFGLLVKQVLYFDRYTKLLAPDMDVLRDDRVVGFDDQRLGAITV